MQASLEGNADAQTIMRAEAAVRNVVVSQLCTAVLGLFTLHKSFLVYKLTLPSLLPTCLQFMSTQAMVFDPALYQEVSP